MEKEIEHIYRCFCNRDYDALKSFIQTCPPSLAKEQVLDVIGHNTPVSALLGMSGLASEYANTAQYYQGLLFGMATCTAAAGYLEESGHEEKEQVIWSIGYCTNAVSKSFNDTSHYQNTAQFFEVVCKNFKSFFDRDEFAAIQLNAIEAYLALNQPEQARKIHDAALPQQWHVTYKDRYQRLMAKIDSTFIPINTLPEVYSRNEKKAALDALEGTISTWRHQTSDFCEGDAKQKILALLHDLDATLADLKQRVDTLDIVELSLACHDAYHKFSMLQSEMGYNLQASNNIYQLQNRTGSAYEILWDPLKGHDPNLLHEALSTLQSVLPQIKGRNADDESTILWAIHSANKRLGREQDALNALETLWRHLENVRWAITDPKEKAGVFRRFRFFFPSLIELYYKTLNTNGAIKAVEASKGRYLYDILADKVRSEVQEEQLSFDSQKLAGLLKPYRAHYLTLFADEDWSYSVLLVNSGKIYMEQIPFGSKKLQAWIEKGYQTPAEWHDRSLGIFGNDDTKISKQLGELLKPLTVALGEGEVKKEDHIVYAPDEQFHLFPLHYIDFDNKPLIATFSLSRIHSGSQLIRLLQTSPSHVRQSQCFVAYTQVDQSNVEQKKAFHYIDDWFQKTEPLKNSSPSGHGIKNVLGEMKPCSLIHFSTHGYFPEGNNEDVVANNPYYNSGLLMMKGDELPKGKLDTKYYSTGHLLSPQVIFESDTKLEDCHLTLQACVSGRAKEGIGGDALGLDLALFYKGAASVMSTAWNVPIDWSNFFSEEFYRQWLIECRSRAAAYRNAMLKLMYMDFPDEYPDTYYWGSMVLSGDFR